MLNFKKLFSVVTTAAIMLTSQVSSFAANDAETTVSPEEVWYENTFSGKDIYEAFPSFENNYLKVVGINSEEDLSVREYYGSAPAFNTDGYIYNSNVSGWKNGVTVSIDFTKGGTVSGITEGKTRISYDFMATNEGTPDSGLQSGVNLENHYSGMIFAGVSKNEQNELYFIVRKDAAWWDVAFNTAENAPNKTEAKLENRKWYSLDMIFDHGTKMVDVYLDGSLIADDVNFGADEMKNFGIGFSGYVAGFDNLKVSRLNNVAGDFKADAYSKGSVDVSFGAAMNTAKGVFTVDGEAAQVQWLSVNKAHITSDKLNSEGTHTVAVNGAEDVFGNAPVNASASFTIHAEEVLYQNDFTGKDIYEAFPSYENNYIKVVGIDSEEDLNEPREYYGSAPSFNTDGYIYHSNSDGWRNGVTVFADFTKNGTQSGVSTGITKISYDFMATNEQSGTPDTGLQTGINMGTASYLGKIFAGVKKNSAGEIAFIVKKSAGDWDVVFDEDGTSNNIAEKTLKNKMWYSLDMIFNHDAKTLDVYLDGSLIANDVNLNTDVMNNFGVGFSGYAAGFDNFKISRLNDFSCGFTADNTGMTDGYVDLTFGGVMDVSKGTFCVDGEIASKTEWLNVNTVRVYSEKLKGGTHTLSFSDVCDIFGNAPEKSTETVTTPAASLTIENGMVKAVVANNKETAVDFPIVIVAVYEADNRLKDCNIYTNFTVDGAQASKLDAGKQAELTVDVSGAEGIVKAFMWDSLIGMKPLIEALDLKKY